MTPLATLQGRDLRLDVISPTEDFASPNSIEVLVEGSSIPANRRPSSA